MKLIDNHPIDSIEDNSLRTYFQICPICDIEMEDGECPECGFTKDIQEVEWDDLDF